MAETGGESTEVDKGRPLAVIQLIIVYSPSLAGNIKANAFSQGKQFGYIEWSKCFKYITYEYIFKFYFKN